LKIVSELEDVEQAIISPDQNGLGPTAQLSEEFRDNQNLSYHRSPEKCRAKNLAMCSASPGSTPSAWER